MGYSYEPNVIISKIQHTQYTKKNGVCKAVHKLERPPEERVLRSGLDTHNVCCWAGAWSPRP